MGTTTGMPNTLFAKLATDIGRATGSAVTKWLEDQGVAAPIATMVGNAVAQPGSPVSLDGSVTLEQAIGQFLPAGVTLPASWAGVTITTLTFAAMTTGPTFTFDGSVAVPLDLAEESATLTAKVDLSSTISDGLRTTTGSLAADLPVGTQDVAVKVDLSTLTGTTVGTIECTWTASDDATISFDDLCAAFGLAPPTAVDDLPDLDLTALKFSVDAATTGSADVTVTATWRDGDVRVSVGTPSGDWVAVLAAEFGGGLAGLGSVGKDLTDLGVDGCGDLTFIASTGDWPHFAVATSAPDDAGSTGDDEPPTIDVTDRFMFVGALEFATSDEYDVADRIATIAADPSTPRPSSVDIVLTGALTQETITASLDSVNVLGFSLATVRLNADFKSAAASLGVDGSLTVNLAAPSADDPDATRNVLTFTAGLGLTAEAVTGDLDVADSAGVAVPDLDGLPSVTIDNLGGLLGVDFDKQEVVVGVEAVFELGNDSPSGSPHKSTLQAMMPAGGALPLPARPQPNEVAIVLGVNDDAGVAPIPDIDLLLLSVPTLDLTDIVAKLLDMDTSRLDDIMGDIQVNDLLLYWCDDVTLKLPDGTTCCSGFRFHGALAMWVDPSTGTPAFDAFATLNVTATEFSGQAIMSPINLGSLDPGSDGQDRWILQISGEGEVDEGSDAAAAGITSGGPYLDVSTTGDPAYFAMSVTATFMGSASVEADVTVGRDMFTFDLDVDLPGVSTAVTCTITNGWTHLEAGFTLGIDGTVDMPTIADVSLPSIHLDVGCDLTMTLDVATGFVLSIGGSFRFGSQTLTIPTLGMNVSFHSMEELPGHILAWIGDQAETIFKDGLQAAEHFLTTYGEDALKEFVKGIDKVADDLKEFVGWVLGVHHSSHSEALVCNADPGSPAEFDVVRESQRRWVPDVTTLAALQETMGPGVNIGALLLASIPRDSVQMPSRINGTMLTRRKDGAMFLLLDDLDDKGNAFPATYRIADLDTFNTVLATYANGLVYQQPPPDQPGAIGQSSGDDIDKIPTNSALSTTCSIQGQGRAEIDAFVDGLRYPIPGGLWQDDTPLAGDFYPNVSTVPTQVVDALPAAAALPALAEGDLLQMPGDDTVYEYSGAKLHVIKDPPDGVTPTQVDAPLTTLFRIGDSHEHLQ